jgi:hypothetical protein
VRGLNTAGVLAVGTVTFETRRGWTDGEHKREVGASGVSSRADEFGIDVVFLSVGAEPARGAFHIFNACFFVGIEAVIHRERDESFGGVAEDGANALAAFIAFGPASAVNVDDGGARCVAGLSGHGQIEFPGLVPLPVVDVGYDSDAFRSQLEEFVVSHDRWVAGTRTGSLSVLRSGEGGRYKHRHDYQKYGFAIHDGLSFHEEVSIDLRIQSHVYLYPVSGLAAIKDGADVNGLDTRQRVAGGNGRRPLNYAASQNDTEMIEALLDADAGVNLTNRSGFTPLHHAAEVGSMDAAKLLITGGASLAQKNRRGQTPAAVAESSGRDETAVVIRKSTTETP